MAARLTGEYIAERHKPGTVFRYEIDVPDLPEGQAALALLVHHDMLNESEVSAMRRLAADGFAPACATIGVDAGSLPATLPGGSARAMRMNNYDIFGPEYPNFLVDELIPALCARHGVRISPSPDMHMVSGASSGGASAWNAAWFRNDFFRRVYMSSPSFLEMGRGRELTSPMRKVETKPIRVYMEYSEDEPNDYFGSSLCAALEAKMALEYAGYDMMCVHFPGEGHSSRYRQNNAETLYAGFKFLWHGWQSDQVRVPRVSPRAEKLLLPGESWREIESPVDFPDRRRVRTASGEYRAEGGLIVFTAPDGRESVAAEGYSDITALARSSDLWRLYVADRARGCVYAHSVQPNGALGGRYILSSLHMRTDFRFPGALDLCVASGDRALAATETGVQLIRSFGLIDVIIELPELLVPEKLALADGALFARAGARTFARRLQLAPAETSAPTPPFPVRYYD